jgi:hypothetical protein
MREGEFMPGKKWLVFGAALALWAAYFYLIDKLIMEGQGLPVGANLMPI